jgi:glyoxylase-like metal-dependent hydrolase (beta-lactamase superfamily II)
MKVISLNTDPLIYSSNSYLVLGTWNKLSDVNTLIDTGTDGFIINEIERINTGVGKKPLDRVILTHSHFDHIGAVAELKSRYGVEVLAFNKFNGVDRILEDGELLRCGDGYLEVIHTPGHSSDSICLYCKQEKILFSGDTAIRIYPSDYSYTADFIRSIERLSMLQLDTIYPGHGNPMTENPEKILCESLFNIRYATKFSNKICNKRINHLIEGESK